VQHHKGHLNTDKLERATAELTEKKLLRDLKEYQGIKSAHLLMITDQPLPAIKKRKEKLK